MNFEERTNKLIEKLAKEAIGKMTNEELMERIKISLKKNGTTLEEMIFIETEKRINAMVENYEYKKRWGIGKNEIISKDEAREKIIKMRQHKKLL